MDQCFWSQSFLFWYEITLDFGIFFTNLEGADEIESFCYTSCLLKLVVFERFYEYLDDIHERNDGSSVYLFIFKISFCTAACTYFFSNVPGTAGTCQTRILDILNERHKPHLK